MWKMNFNIACCQHSHLGEIKHRIVPRSDSGERDHKSLSVSIKVQSIPSKSMTWRLIFFCRCITPLNRMKATDDERNWSFMETCGLTLDYITLAFHELFNWICAITFFLCSWERMLPSIWQNSANVAYVVMFWRKLKSKKHDCTNQALRIAKLGWV